MITWEIVHLLILTGFASTFWLEHPQKKIGANIQMQVKKDNQQLMDCKIKIVKKDSQQLMDRR
nr:317_t:CDS:2 [Entrophospora candida]